VAEELDDETLAAYHAHPDTVDALLQRGADIARTNDRGRTVLAAAVFRTLAVLRGRS
jgi:hypothetical protein